MLQLRQLSARELSPEPVQENRPIQATQPRACIGRHQGSQAKNVRSFTGFLRASRQQLKIVQRSLPLSHQSTTLETPLSDEALAAERPASPAVVS